MIASEGAPAETEPVPAETLAAWEAELTGLLARSPAQRITDPDKAAAYFAAGLLKGVWRHSRAARCAATAP